jgi:hypothetical protein
MTERIVCKQDIAREYIDAAIEFFLEGRNYFCVIHLAAAAEELLGAHRPKDKHIFTLAWKAQKELRSETGLTPSDKEARNDVNKWKHQVKHMSDGVPTLTIDEAAMAEWHIEHALVNYYHLKLPKSAAIWRFEAYQNDRGDEEMKGLG